MIDKNLLIKRAIPFGDITEGELHEMRKFEHQIEQAEDASVQRNPRKPRDPNAPKKPKKAGMTGVYAEHFVPLGEEMFHLADFYNAADAVGTAASLAKIQERLAHLLNAARKVYPLTAPEGADKDFVTYEKSAYYRAVTDLLEWLEDPIKRTPPRPIFAEGNGKLPFWCFSTLAGTTCPSAGACLVKNAAKAYTAKGNRGWCYSFKAWRQIFPFFRCLQNTLLVRLKNKRHILADIEKIGPDDPVRLYVDGDMDSVETIAFWMDICRSRPYNKFYGYSKSWDLFLEYHRRYVVEGGGDWPDNYVLNLSSGSIFESDPNTFPAWLNAMQQLPIVRGRFVAVKVKTKFPKDETDTKTKHDYNAEVTAAVVKDFGVTPVVCPNYCGDCLNGKHACGSKKESLQGKIIAIGVH